MMAVPPSPIAYFAFNRPEHTTRTLAALAACEGASATDLHIYVDGPRDQTDRLAVDEVVRIARAISGFRSKRVVTAALNQGLYRAITTGVAEVLSAAGRVIVVEDDVLVTPQFLAYMNAALERYANQPKVGAIHGYSPPINGLPEYFFLPGADCWGWATWADRWALFDPDASALLRALVSRGLLDQFCASHGSRSLLLLARRARGLNQSWAILWHASLFLAGRCTLHPGHSLVNNIGNDGTGAHAARSAMHTTTAVARDRGPLPVDVCIDRNASEHLRRFLDSGNAASRLLLRGYAKLVARFPQLTR